MAKVFTVRIYGHKQEQTAKIRKEHAVHPWGSEINRSITEITCRNQVAKLNRKPKGAMPQNVNQLAMDFAKLTIALDVSFS